MNANFWTLATQMSKLVTAHTSACRGRGNGRLDEQLVHCLSSNVEISLDQCSGCST